MTACLHHRHSLMVASWSVPIKSRTNQCPTPLNFYGPTVLLYPMLFGARCGPRTHREARGLPTAVCDVEFLLSRPFRIRVRLMGDSRNMGGG